MKAKFLRFFLLMVVFCLSGCPYAHLGMKDREMTLDRAGGYLSPEEGLGVMELQAQTQTLILVQKQLQEAIRNKDTKEIERLELLLQDLNNGVVSTVTGTLVNANVTANSANGTRMLGVMNRTYTFVITMKSDPFSGLVLAPGEYSRVRRPVEIGVYKAVYEECQTGKSYCRTKRVNVTISRTRTEPLAIFEEY